MRIVRKKFLGQCLSVLNRKVNPQSYCLLMTLIYQYTNSEMQCQKMLMLQWVCTGFVIQSDKSILRVAQKKEFLGFVIDSVDMAFSVNSEKSSHYT